ncbi:MAG: Clp protease N-terminal domain-containing protein [Solirubrobacteraceae bacterium]
MFERFTEAARQVVVKAQEEARGLNHNYIGTEHLLLGLLFEQDRIADRVLLSFGVTSDRVRDQVVKIVGWGEEPTAGQIPFTPRAKKVMELGLRESLSLRHNNIETEHLLLGLLREDDGLAMRILLDFDLKPDEVRKAVIEMAPGPDRDPPRTMPSVRRSQSGFGGADLGFAVTPDAHTRRVLMRAAAHALADARTQFTVQDLAVALWGDEDAAAAIAALAASETPTDTPQGPVATSGEPEPTPDA